MVKPIFVLVTAQDCPACVNFHKTWSQYKKQLNQLGLVDIIVIDLPKRATPVESKGYPKDLQRYLLWFPMGLMFPRDNWDAVSKGRETKLNAIVFNGKVGNENPKQDYPHNGQGMVEWVKVNAPKMQRPHHNLYEEVKRKYSSSPEPPDLCTRMKLRSRRK
jgi:hypothetical protein